MQIEEIKNIHVSNSLSKENMNYVYTYDNIQGVTFKIRIPKLLISSFIVYWSGLYTSEKDKRKLEYTYTYIMELNKKEMTLNDNQRISKR